MSYLIICGVGFAVSGLTLFSGFGLGTLLMPAFAMFFPVPVAVAVTAVVHLASNLFKTVLVGRQADWPVGAKFALPGAAAAVFGAMLLNVFSLSPSVATFQFGGKIHEVALVELVIGILIVLFAVLGMLPRFHRLAFDRKHLPLGGVISGFFGGLSGLQGAMRSAFLIKAGLGKEFFIGTSAVSAVVVDVARLIVYGLSFYTTKFASISHQIRDLVLAATLAAFVGAFIGARLMKNVTLRTVQIIVGILLIVVGLGMASGMI
jgi:uncharacterized membrane protein YfcA